MRIVFNQTGPLPRRQSDAEQSRHHGLFGNINVLDFSTDSFGKLFSHLAMGWRLRAAEVIGSTHVPFLGQRSSSNRCNIAHIYRADLRVADRSKKLALFDDWFPERQQCLHKEIRTQERITNS